jgi:hypothetical protein
LSVPAGFFILLLAFTARAHDIALDVRWAADGALEGQLTYSDEKAAEGNYVRVAVNGDPGFATIALQTDAQGRFRLPLRPDLAYEIEASGEEGHRITAAVGPRGRASTPDAISGGIPVYVWLGAVLLLSLPLAWRLRRAESTRESA